MEAFLFHSSSSPDQPFPPSKTTPIMKTQTKGAAAGNRGGQQRSPFNLPRVSDNFVAPLNLQNNITGLLPAPFTPYYVNLYHSYPPFPMKQQPPPQPPLLPLPIVPLTKTNKTSNIIKNPRIIRNLSCPPVTTTNRRIKNGKTKNPTTKGVSLKKLPLGPDLKDLPKVLPKTLTLSSGSDCTNYGFSSVDAMRDDHHRVDEFSGSVAFTVSPPPSSLPLPTFSLRQKLSCKAEAAGVDAGATDNLCRLLRLR